MKHHIYFFIIITSIISFSSNSIAMDTGEGNPANFASELRGKNFYFQPTFVNGSIDNSGNSSDSSVSYKEKAYKSFEKGTLSFIEHATFSTLELVLKLTNIVIINYCQQLFTTPQKTTRPSSELKELEQQRIAEELNFVTAYSNLIKIGDQLARQEATINDPEKKKSYKSNLEYYDTMLKLIAIRLSNRLNSEI